MTSWILLGNSWSQCKTEASELSHQWKREVDDTLAPIHYWLMGVCGTHSSTFAWKIPWTEESGRLQSMQLLRVGHDWTTSLLLFTFMHWRRKWQPTPMSLPGESQGRGSLVGCRLWGCRVGHDWSDLAAACSHLLSALCVVGEKIIRSRKRGEPRSAWITNTIMRHHYPPLPSGESSQPKAPMYADGKKDKGKYILLNKHLD